MTHAKLPWSSPTKTNVFDSTKRKCHRRYQRNGIIAKCIYGTAIYTPESCDTTVISKCVEKKTRIKIKGNWAYICNNGTVGHAYMHCSCSCCYCYHRCLYVATVTARRKKRRTQTQLFVVWITLEGCEWEGDDKLIGPDHRDNFYEHKLATIHEKTKCYISFVCSFHVSLWNVSSRLFSSWFYAGHVVPRRTTHFLFFFENKKQRRKRQ